MVYHVTMFLHYRVGVQLESAVLKKKIEKGG